MDAAAFEQVYGSFRDFHAYFATLFGRRETREHSGHYLQALLVQSGERRNAENLSETVPGSARGMQRFLTDSPWDDEVIIGRLQEYLGPRLEHPEGVWVLDGSDFPKQGRKSVGVARQYCGRLGKVAICQAGMFLAYFSPLARGWVKSASSKVPSSSPQEKDPSPTNAAEQQHGIPRKAPSRTMLRRIRPSRTVRVSTNGAEASAQAGRPIAVATSGRGDKRPKSADSAGTAKTPASQGRPGARFAPHGTGCPASRPGNERPSRKSRSQGRTRSPDKTPGPGPGSIVSGRNRGRSGRFAHLEPHTGRIGKPLGMPSWGPCEPLGWETGAGFSPSRINPPSPDSRTGTDNQTP